MTPEEENYLKIMAERAEDGDTEGRFPAGDEAAPNAAPSTASSDQAALDAQSKANTAQGSDIGKAGDATTAAGAASGNPYVAAAGLALKATGAVDDAHRAAEQQKIDAYNKKIMGQRAAVRNLFA